MAEMSESGEMFRRVPENDQKDAVVKRSEKYYNLLH